MADEEIIAAELPLETVATRLARGREAAGLSRAELSHITKIPERHLAAIEAGEFASLPARAYAVGFSRTYARAVGLDEATVVAQLREELAMTGPEPRRAMPAFEPGDPARVPSARLAWASALAALIAILAGFAFWRSYYLPGGALPPLVSDTPSQAASVTAPAAVTAGASAAQPSGGAVVFTALIPDLWVKFYDASGNQLMQKQMAQGESYTIPAGLEGVQLWTGRPESLAITVGGQPVAKLAETQRTVKDVPVSAAALLARPAPGSAPVVTPTAASQPMPTADR